ncbi:MAG: hypothetical protein LH618_15005 [Saprospiraceae bacterium]|nr:hypothetical protein [Saprospiraceae bacterium]
MKIPWNRIPVIALLAVLLSFNLQAQEDTSADSTGLPGDNFSLAGALELFKKAESLEGFEKALNTEDNDVNNLDLNQDGQIDYVRVIDRMDGDAHAIVLQVPVNASEAQDIAVIEIEKDGAESATLQILGDEDIYGQTVIAEPFEEDGIQKDGRHGPAMHLAPAYIVVNVWGWPSVRYIYRPAYVVYVSPWRWGVYPTWWRPYRPRPWGYYHARVRPYRTRYHVVTTHRVVRAHNVYSGHRTHSTVVKSRTVTHVNKNGRRGGKVQATKTTKSTTVHGRRGGSVTKQQSTTKVKGGQRGRH